MNDYLHARRCAPARGNLMHLGGPLNIPHFAVDFSFWSLYERDVVARVLAAERPPCAAFLHQTNSDVLYLDIDRPVGHEAADLARAFGSDFVYALSSRDYAHVVFDRPADLDALREAARATDADSPACCLRLPFSRKRAYQTDPDIYASLFDSSGAALAPSAANLARFSIVSALRSSDRADAQAPDFGGQ